MNKIVWSDIAVQFITLTILILVIVLTVLSFRETFNKFKQVDRKSIIYMIADIALLLLVWFILDFMGINTIYVVPNLIEWATKFILPWILLYWGIRLIKGLEKK